MPQDIIEPPILDETMTKPKSLPSNQDQSIPISYKRPRDNQISPILPPKIKQVYKAKEKVVEQPSIVPFAPPLREEKNHMVYKPASTQSQLEN
jgi:hypothetical protein